jgi:hypothetical protein
MMRIIEYMLPKKTPEKSPKRLISMIIVSKWFEMGGIN